MTDFNTISNEILVHIHDKLGGDLLAHISFSQTSRRLRRLYEDGTLWQTACFKAGFGRPKRRVVMGEAMQELSWRELAYILVRHASDCEIKTCKAANACFTSRYRSMSRSSIREPLTFPPDVELHPLYFYLHFSETAPDAPHMPSPDTLAILLTHLPTFPECKTSQYGPLCVHPNASCAFATFPPMQTIGFRDANGDPFLTVHNPDGCTLLDVNRALCDLIPRDFEQMEAALAHYHELLFTSGKTLMQFAECISRDKGFLDDHEYPFLRELVAQA
ncbi:uncharacterized protein PHACADRAFT_254952 [Phanerochaete carnosa HHB-10118-sp]|uniref:F-box domain-containing protein n=1 Tax=Phanerochaete carnosa (strain HHB-10118-sp) TaxID=650164 RepID=K5WDB9_PHACS|nr:uncharacterized protein PHACADRAFT_254952 [Phanerochaete carnosa HHB-10118-sp]EKM57270.1 hypothetical protein PHACADRAFT_254952 [Phanerochaete carnosa HHB-10118-sp]